MSNPKLFPFRVTFIGANSGETRCTVMVTDYSSAIPCAVRHLIAWGKGGLVLDKDNVIKSVLVEREDLL